MPADETLPGVPAADPAAGKKTAPPAAVESATATAAADRSAEPLVRVRVSPGRTLCIPHPTRKRIVARSENGVVRNVEVPAKLEVPAGSHIELPRREAERLRRLGHVADPSEGVLAPEALPPQQRDDRPGA